MLKKFSNKLRTMSAMSVLGILAVTGCTPQPKPDTDITKDVAYTLNADIPSRISDLTSHVTALSGIVGQLPGPNAGEHARLGVAAIDEMLQILPVFEGDQPTTDFVGSLQVFKQCKITLSNPDTAEPGFNQSLICAETALRNINKLVFDNNADTVKSLDSVRMAMAELDAVHGATARVVQGQISRQISSVIQVMTAALIEKSGTDGKPVAKPVQPVPTPEKAVDPAKPEDVKPDAPKPVVE